MPKPAHSRQCPKCGIYYRAARCPRCQRVAEGAQVPMLERHRGRHPQEPLVQMDGAKLQAAREGRGWSAYRLAQQSGLSESTIKAIETGHHRQSQRSTVQRLAQALGLPVSALGADDRLAGPAQRE